MQDSRRTNVGLYLTDRPDYTIKVSVWYNDAYIGRRGYWASIHVCKADGPFELMPVTGKGTRSIKLESAERFNQKQFRRVVESAIAGSYQDLRNAISSVKAEAPEVNL